MECLRHEDGLKAVDGGTMCQFLAPIKWAMYKEMGYVLKEGEGFVAQVFGNS